MVDLGRKRFEDVEGGDEECDPADREQQRRRAREQRDADGGRAQHNDPSGAPRGPTQVTVPAASPRRPVHVRTHGKTCPWSAPRLFHRELTVQEHDRAGVLRLRRELKLADECAPSDEWFECGAADRREREHRHRDRESDSGRDRRVRHEIVQGKERDRHHPRRRRRPRMRDRVDAGPRNEHDADRARTSCGNAPRRRQCHGAPHQRGDERTGERVEHDPCAGAGGEASGRGGSGRRADEHPDREHRAPLPACEWAQDPYPWDRCQ